MPIYTASSGKQSETSDMPIEYIQRALAKAKSNGDQNNIDALEYEIKQRNGN